MTLGSVSESESKLNVSQSGIKGGKSIRITPLNQIIKIATQKYRFVGSAALTSNPCIS